MPNFSIIANDSHSNLKKMIKKIFLLFFLDLPLQACAELPLTVEDLIGERGKIRLDYSVSYANSERSSIRMGEPLIVQTGATSFVRIPTRVGEVNANDDLLVSTLGMRYGLTSRTEIYGRGSYLYGMYRSSGAFGPTSSIESRFVDSWIGANYRFKFDDDTPAVIGFTEFSIRERDAAGGRSFKSNMVGITAYKSIDPIVFSVTSAYRVNRGYVADTKTFKPGNLVMLTPSISFAANSFVTLSAGVQWSSRRADRINQVDQGALKTSTDLILGINYSVNQKNSVGLSMRTNSSGRNGAGLRLNWLSSL